MKQIKIYGERNSGTIYLEWLINKNFEIELLKNDETGWKHRLAPSKEEIEYDLNPEIYYLCLVKNPYSWLLSMHKRPYQHEELRKLRFRDFLKYSYGDYRNPIMMWNLKNRSYLELGNYTKNHIFFRYEDFLESIAEPLNTIASKFGIAKPPFYKNIHVLLTNSHGISKNKFHAEYYTEEIWKEKLNPDHIETINQFLDKDLMNKLEYSFL